MSNRFPETISAMSRAQAGQWEIADALLREVGPPPGGVSDHATFKEIESSAERLGFDYNAYYLRQMRDLAIAFPSERRHHELSFTVHHEARAPETLDRAIALAAVENRRVTHRLIRHMRGAIDRAEAHAAANVEHLGAHRDNEKPVTELDLTIDGLDLMTVTSEALSISEKHVKRVMGADLSGVDPAFIDAALSEALSAAENYRKIADRLRGRASAGGRKHLSVA